MAWLVCTWQNKGWRNTCRYKHTPYLQWVHGCQTCWWHWPLLPQKMHTSPRFPADQGVLFKTYRWQFSSVFLLFVSTDNIKWQNNWPMSRSTVATAVSETGACWSLGWATQVFIKGHSSLLSNQDRTNKLGITHAVLKSSSTRRPLVSLKVRLVGSNQKDHHTPVYCHTSTSTSCEYTGGAECRCVPKIQHPGRTRTGGVWWKAVLILTSY